ncbi:MAG: phosphate ABC transporter permease, partial [Shewanella sp.]
SIKPPLPAGVSVTSAALTAPSEQRFALGLSDGQVLIVGIEFGLSYPNNKRLITPKLRYSAGDTAITIDENGSAINKLAFTYTSDKSTFAYQDASGTWRLSRVEGVENMMTEAVEWTLSSAVIADAPKKVAHQLMTPDQRQLMLQMDNKIYIYNIRDVDNVSLMQVIDAEKDKHKINQMALLAGASSILVSYDSGIVTQYFQVNGHKGRLYQEIREFNDLAPVASIAAEFYRKSFAVVSPEGELSLLYTTSERNLFEQKFDIKNPGVMGFSPRSNGIVIEADNKLNLFHVENAHPEVSWSALWTKVWYEGYPEPQYVWQSTSGSDDFEAKLSLMPLVFGTMKAAFYAMLFAVPLSIAGAIYTAYFMSAKVRRIVKPTIEIMGALPTVILGFMAGLWLAPLVEENLPGILVLLVLLPISILSSAFVWSRLPGKWKQRLPEIYQELMLIPVICFIGWLSFAISP